MRRRNFVFRLSPSLQMKIVAYLNEFNESLANLINQAMDHVYEKYAKYLTIENGTNALWKRSRNVLRLGTTIDKERYQKLSKISELTGRSISDLVKEGLWDLVND